MAFYSKPKDEHATPQPCERCRARPGTSRIFFARPRNDDSAPMPPMWLCTACRDDVRRDAAGN